jgi:pyruvate,water dikinase
MNCDKIKQMEKGNQKILKGQATVIKARKDYYETKERVILVAKNTSPDLVVVIDRIKAIVVEVDSKLCHAAIIAREFKKPLLMGVIDATKNFKTGDKIIVDFNKKTIKKIK